MPLSIPAATLKRQYRPIWWKSHHLGYKQGIELGSVTSLPGNKVVQLAFSRFSVLPVCRSSCIVTARCRSRQHSVYCHCCQSCAHLAVRIVFLAVFVRFPSIGSRKQPNHSRKSYASVLSVLIDFPRSPVSGRNKLVVLSNYRSGCCIARPRSGKKPHLRGKCQCRSFLCVRR